MKGRALQAVYTRTAHATIPPTLTPATLLPGTTTPARIAKARSISVPYTITFRHNARQIQKCESPTATILWVEDIDIFRSS